MALEQFFGRIVDVTRRTDGDELTAAAGISDTVLSVGDTADFDETGGQILFGGDVYEYEEVDHDANTLTLTTGVTVAGAVGDPVDVFDPELGQVVVEYVANVLLDDQDPDDEPIEVTVSHALVPMLEESIRGGATESVTLIRDGEDDMVIWQVDGKLAVDILADAAVASAAAAFDEATAALSAVELAIAISDGRIDTYFQTTAPWANGSTAHDDDLGDLWYDTDSGTPALVYRWMGKFDRSWVLVDDQSIVAALAQAQSAQTTADGKIRLFVTTWALRPTLASHPDLGYGDLLRATDQDNKEYYWDGDSWEPLVLGDDGIDTTLTGKVIRTAASGNRMEMRQDGGGGVIHGYTGAAGETVPAKINPELQGGAPTIVIQPGNATGYGSLPYLYLKSGSSGNTAATISASDIALTGDVFVHSLDILSAGAITGLGRTLNALDFGNKTGTTDASGDISVNHNLGMTPVAITFGGNTTAGGRTYHVASKNSSSFTVRVKDDTGSPLASTAVDFFWDTKA